VFDHVGHTYKDLWKTLLCVCVGFLEEEPKSQSDSEGQI
jgi:hypothetical protein